MPRVLEEVRRPMWLEQSEQGGREVVRAGKGCGRLRRALWAMEDVGFYPEGSRCPGLCSVEKGRDCVET